MASALETLIFEIIANDKGASAAFDKFRGKVDQTTQTVDKNSASLEKSATSLLKQKAAADNAGKSADSLFQKITKLAGSTGGGGGIAGGGMGALVAAGAALSPVIITLGTGFAGLGAAAYGIAKPIENAAQATGGLRANMASLNPEQQQVAKGILSLGQTFSQFQKAVQPQVLGIFTQGLKIAQNVLTDIEPVTKATGIAFESFLGQLDKTFQSGEFQNFFKFMATTAGPDVQLLGNLFIDLAKDIPPLVESLQPLAVTILKVADVAAKLIGFVAQAHLAIPVLGATIGAMFGGPLGAEIGLVAGGLFQAGVSLAGLGHQASQVKPVFESTGKQVVEVTGAVARFGTSAGQAVGPTSAAGKTVGTLGDMAHGTVTTLKDLATQINNVHTAETKSLDTLTAYNDAIIAQYNSAKSLNDALKTSHDRIGLATAAQRNSFSAADQYITQTIKAAQAAQQSNQGIGAVINSLKAELPRLENVKGGTQAYWQEVRTLVGWLHTLQAQRAINEQIHVTGKGSFSVVGTGPFAGKVTGFAAGTQGATPGWAWVGEKGPELINMRGGETVLPHSMSMAVTRGYASGVFGSYSGPVPGIPPFIDKGNHLAVNAIASAVAAGVRSVVQSASTGPGIGARPGGGAPAANAALARSMYPPWGSGVEWAAWNAVAMAESGWNQFARNPSSGAYGIPQALPPGKMGAAANPPQSNPGAQIAWMIQYIKSVYGDPVRAWAHESAYHWYDKGGVLKPGLTLAYNGTGRNEQVVPPGGQKIVLEVKASHDTALEKFIVGMVQKYVIVHGGDAQVALGQRV